MDRADRPKMYKEQIVTIEDLKSFEDNLIAKFKVLMEDISEKSGHKKKWLKSGEVKKLLGISNGTLFNLRVTGKLSPNKIGGTLFFSYDEIAKLMDSKDEH